jgi:hypothetical protein
MTASLQSRLGTMALTLMLGCAAPAPSEDVIPGDTVGTSESRALADHLAATLAAAPSATDDGVRVHLAFPAGADLDLYVTDPTFETVYFANSPNRAGGRLDADVRCSEPAPRIETIRFPAALPGVYRVGVDFPERCRGGAIQEAFVVQIEGGGLEATREGIIEAGHFIPIVLEVTAQSDTAPHGPQK